MNDVMLKIPGTPWQDLGTHIEEQIVSSEQLIETAKCTYTVSSEPMYTDRSQTVMSYHAIYRDDTNQVLGVVNSNWIDLIQNVDSFKVVEPLIRSGEVSVDTIAEFASGRAVYGVFQIKEPYEIHGDKIQHYILVVNDHTKPNGKIQIINTPIRVVCMNALSHALSKAVYSVSVPVLPTYEANKEIAAEIMSSCAKAITNLNQNVDKLLEIEVSTQLLDDIVDELFPLVAPPQNAITIQSSSRANETVEMMRSQFIDCINEDNLANFSGTGYQVYNALADMTQHYHKTGKYAYDLDHRIQNLPGIGVLSTESAKVSKLLKILKSQPTRK